MKRWAVSVPFLLLAAMASAAEQGLFASRFVRSLVVDSGTIGKAESLIYGNPEYGFFETREISEHDGKVSTRLVPPGYKYPLAVYLKQRDQNGDAHLERMPDVRFPYPLGPNEYAPAPFPVEGSLTSPFFVGNGSVEIAGNNRGTALVLNRQGEVVWLYRGPNGRQPHVLKPLGNGRYAIVTLVTGEFDVTDFEGKVDAKFGAAGRLRLHHDFLFGGGDKLVAFTYRGHDFPGDPQSVLIPDRYAVGQVIGINLKTAATSLLWDAFYHGPWLHGPGWSPHDLFSVEIGTGIAPANRDFEHINSIDWSPGRGYLVSLRNFHTLALLDETFRLRWTLGSAPGTNMGTKGTAIDFYRQHHATFLPNGDILMVDNGSSRSRLLQIRVDDQSPSVTLVREFMPRDPIFSPGRGSAFRLSNGNTFGFFPRILPRPDPSYIVEFDSQGNQIAMLTIPKKELQNAYRFIPIEAIGRETYLGSSPNRR